MPPINILLPTELNLQHNAFNKSNANFRKKFTCCFTKALTVIQYKESVHRIVLRNECKKNGCIQIYDHLKLFALGSYSKTDLEVHLYVSWNAAESAVLPAQLWAVRRYRKQPVVSSNSRMPVSFQMLQKW